MDYYPLLLQKLTEEQINLEVQSKINSFHGFLTREVALKLIAKEQNLIKKEPEKLLKISELQPNSSATTSGKIIQINPEITFPSGKRVRSLIIKDETGSATLNLWEKDIDWLSKLKIGDIIKVSDAYFKNNELSLGYKGRLEIIDPAKFSDLENLQDGQVHIKSFINKIYGFEKNSFLFTISEKSIKCKITEDVERGKKMQEGDEILIQNALAAKNEIAINSSSRLLIRKVKGILRGKLEELEYADGLVLIKIDGKPLTLDKAKAMEFLNLNVAEDISLDTLIKVKKDSLLNSQVSVKC